MLPTVRIWAAGLALILGGCRESAETAVDPDPVPPSEPPVAGEKALEEEATPPDFVEPLRLAGEAFRQAEAGNGAEATRLYQATLASLPEGAASREPEFVARVHDALGRAFQDAGHYDKAETHLAAGLRLRIAVCKREPGNVAAETDLGISEGHLGLLDLLRGRYAEAGRRFRQALNHTPERDDLLLAHRYDCLGRYHLALRSPQLAREDYEMAVRHASLGASPDRALLSDLRANLALCRFRAGDRDGALGPVQALLDELHDDDPPLRRAELLNLSGTIHASLAHHAEAGTRIRRALEIVSEIKGENHPALATYLANEASVRLSAGDAVGALAPLQQAKRILLDHVSQHHQALVEVLYQIALCKLLAAPRTEARQAVVEARRVAGELMSTLVATGSERELLTFRQDVDLHSIVCRLGNAKLIAQSLLDGKGRLMEAVLQRRTRFEQRTRAIHKLQVELDALLLRGSPASRQRIAGLRKQIDDLAGATLAPPAHPPPPGRWEIIRDTLPSHTAFVDCVRFLPAEDARPRYGAVVHLSGRAPQWIPLGEERLLRNRLHNLHSSLKIIARNLRTGNHQQGLPIAPLLTALHEAFWQPVAAALPDTIVEIILAPEGQLHLLPFAVLRNEGGQFLCQDLAALHLVPSARTLLQQPVPPVDLDKPWAVFGITKFGPHRTLLRRGTHEWIGEWAAALADLGDLPTVDKELNFLRKRAPRGSSIISDKRAGHSALRALATPPAVLHLASHGFHVPLGESRDLAADPAALYESGILLGLDQHGDGILFPEEAGNLNLRGTSLVTLSTCRSALGRPVSGEGLLGFRRAFAMAGARNILASLWEIPDQSTAEFMSAFYQALSAKQPPQVSLWKLQAARFHALRSENPHSIGLERAILSYGGFLVTSPGGLPPL